jgi:hypothetical protein
MYTPWVSINFFSGAGAHPSKEAIEVRVRENALDLASSVESTSRRFKTVSWALLDCNSPESVLAVNSLAEWVRCLCVKISDKA